MQEKGTYFVLSGHIYVAVSLIGAPYRVNLVAANHVHLLEPHWNPMVEAQAVDRVHRIGQSREVLTTRYITRDSIETVRLPESVVPGVDETSLTSNSMSSGFKRKNYSLSINRWILPTSHKKKSTSNVGRFVLFHSETHDLKKN